jgi:hypothetical protein
MIRTLCSTSICLFLVACSAESKPTDAAKSAAPGAAAPAAAEIATKLAAADAKDGKVDKVVHKCAGCSLGMDGEEKWSLPVEGYTMHFCKQACFDRFKNDTAKEIGALMVAK